MPFPSSLKKLLSRGRPVFVFDFDGTLAKLEASPGKARITGGMRRQLRMLEGLAKVMVLSSRPLGFLHRALFFLEKARVYGAHGMQTRGRSESIGHGERKELGRLGRRLSLMLPRHDGAQLEDKPFGFVVHFRECTRSGRKRLERALGELGRAAGMRMYAGRNAVEMLAPGSLTKARMLEKLANNLGGGEFMLYFGDDAADEEAFRMLQSRSWNAWGVAVGMEASSAKYGVRGVGELERAIGKINKLLAAKRME